MKQAKRLPVNLPTNGTPDLREALRADGQKRGERCLTDIRQILEESRCAIVAWPTLEPMPDGLVALSARWAIRPEP